LTKGLLTEGSLVGALGKTTTSAEDTGKMGADSDAKDGD